MNKRAVISATLVISALAIGWGYKHKQVTAIMATEAAWVKVTKVEEATVPKEVRAIGTLTAHSVDIISEIAGHVDTVYFQDGAAVKQGDVLIKLDDSIYKAKNESAQAKLKLSELNFKRIDQLGKKGMISKQAIDQAESDLKERRAEAAETSAMLNKMVLKAPFNGVVGKSNVGIGDYVNTGQELVKLTDISHYRIEYNLPEKYIASIAPNQTVSITTASYPDKIFNGKVSFISPTINTDSRTLFVYADIPNDQKLLAAGMFVDVSHSLGSDEKILMIPERSLVPVLDGDQVYKVVDGKAYAVDAVTGRRQHGKVQISRGLAPNDTVITDGQMKLKNGMPVKIKS